VKICTPTSNAVVTSPLQVLAQGKDAQPIKRLQLYVDGVGKFTTNSSQLNTSVTLSGGTHRLTVVSTNSANVATKATELVSVAIPPVCDVSSAPTPSVTICSPAPNATVSSPVQITAQSKDSQPTVRTQLYVDGVAKYTVNSDQMNISYTLASGPHRLTVTSTDAANVTSKATINVTVQ
jgi:hypothetical protein